MVVRMLQKASDNKDMFNAKVIYDLRYISLEESKARKGKSSGIASASNPNGFYFDNDLPSSGPKDGNDPGDLFKNTEAFISFVESALVLQVLGGRYGEYAGVQNNYAPRQFVQSFFQFQRLPVGYLPPSKPVQVPDVVGLALKIYGKGPQQKNNQLNN